MQQTQPDMRGLGLLALLLAALSAVLSVSYFYSLLAYLPAAIAIPLGVAARGHWRSRALGTVAVLVAVTAVACATLLLLGVF